LKAVLFSLGSRGDIEPFFAIGEILKGKGWEVVYVFPEQFRELVGNVGHTFYPFTKEFLELLLEGEQAKMITSQGGSLLTRIQILISLAKRSIRINNEITQVQKEIIDREKPDYVFYNQKCVYPVVWDMNNKGKGIFVHPFPCFLHRVDHHSIIGFSGGGNYGRYLNRVGYALQSFAISLAVRFSTRPFYTNDGDVKINVFRIRRWLLHKAKSIYPISPSLFPRPSYWPANAHVVGHYERPKASKWSPDDELLHFLNRHRKIIFITFGSISNTDPKKVTDIILRVLVKNKIPAIINTSWGGLLKPDQGSSENILFVNNIPYDWIFPKMYAVVHHGGAGTTHSALRFGCASLVIPHFIDQFFWNDRVHDLGLGPKGVSIQKLNSNNFEIIILELLKNRCYRQSAQLLAAKMASENNAELLMKIITSEI
jgi:sterol 3beta-glucosyltransferase